jgi:hypothetical protein
MRSRTGATLLPNRQKERKVKTIQYDTGLSTRRDGKIGRHVRVRLAKAITVAVAVRTTGAAGLGASAQRLVDDGLDGARATAALGAASETTVNLLGVARKMLRTLDGTAHIMVAKHVTGTDDHLSGGPIGDAETFKY